MDFSKMFLNKEPNFAGIFGDERKPIFQEEQTEIEKLAIATLPGCNPKTIQAYYEHFDHHFSYCSKANTDVTNDSVDLAQGMAYESEANNKHFQTLYAIAQDLRSKIAPVTKGIIFKRLVEPVKMSAADLERYVDKLQLSLGSMKANTSPFLQANYDRMRTRSAALIRELEICVQVCQLAVKLTKNEDWEVKQERTMKVLQLARLSEASISRMGKEIQRNKERIVDFTQIAIPVMLMQIQDFIVSQNDPSNLLQSIDALLTKDKP